jgi:hypothetical protein
MSRTVSEQIAQAIAQDDEGRAYCAARERACEEHALLLRRSADGLVYKTPTMRRQQTLSRDQIIAPKSLLLLPACFLKHSNAVGIVGPRLMSKFFATKFACLRTTLVQPLVSLKRKSRHWRTKLPRYAPTMRSYVALCAVKTPALKQRSRDASHAA